MEKAFKVLTLNCRGLNNTDEMKKLFTWIQDNDYNIICLQETYCTKKLKPIFDNCWYGKCVHALSDSSHSRGTTIMFRNTNNMNFKIVNSHVSQDGRRALCNVLLDDETFTIVSVYAPNKEKDRKSFFKRTSKWIMQYATNADNIISCGDYNCCLREEDRLPKTHVNDASRNAMNEMMRYCKLYDVWQENDANK